MEQQNIDPAEVAKFDQLAARWWDPEGEFRPLHDLNPVRLEYINTRAPLVDQKVVDIGCGGGLLAEAMASTGAQVTGIDAGAEVLGVARLHGYESGVEVEYIQTTAEEFATLNADGFDVVTCMELLEHLPNPESVIAAAARLAKPGGMVFFSTIHRTPRAYLTAILGAEYLLRLLPRGTHDYARFIRPSELTASARANGLMLQDLSGLHYNPLNRHCRLTADVSVNYLMHFQRETHDAHA